MEHYNPIFSKVPTLRFDFDGIWNKIHLYEITNKVSRKAPVNSTAPIRMISYGNGFILQSDKYSRDNAGESLKKYTLLKKGEMAYNHGASKNKKYGVCNSLKESDEARIPFVYHAFQINRGLPAFWNYALNISQIDKQLKKLVSSGARMDGLLNISYDDYMSISVYEPCVDEQAKISAFLSVIDKRIAVQNKIIEDLKVLKKELCNDHFKSVLHDASLKYITLKEILTERKEYCSKDGTYTHGTLSKEGVAPKTERYDRDFLVKNEDKQYKVTHLNDICYNPANLKFGVICRNTYGDLIFSPIYVTFKISDNVYPAYIELFLTNQNFIGRIRRYEQGTVYERMAVSPEDFLSYETHMPTYEEQVKFANEMQCIQRKIELETAFLSFLQRQRKYLLNAMFI